MCLPYLIAVFSFLRTVPSRFFGPLNPHGGRTAWYLRRFVPHSSNAESPYFVLHGMNSNLPSITIPNGGVSCYAMDNHIGDYRMQLLQSTAEVRTYCFYRAAASPVPLYGCATERMEWSISLYGTSISLLEASQNSAPITRIERGTY